MKHLLFILTLLTVGCGAFKGDPGSNGSVGPKGDAGQNGKDYVTSAYTFGSNTTCQQIFSGYSAKKSGASTDILNVYSGATCSGSVLSALKATTNEVYETSTFRGTIEGTNATGLTLYVGAK